MTIQNLKKVTLGAALIVGLLTGCGKKDAPTETPAAEPAAPAETAPTDAPPPPPVPGGANSAPAPEAAPAEEKIDALTQVKNAIQSFVISNERPPKDLNELVRMKYLKSLPAAPPGKKFVYDPSRMDIKLVNQ
jgi:hypothetical protein